jgi:dihydropteroate synthase-like protein
MRPRGRTSSTSGCSRGSPTQEPADPVLEPAVKPGLLESLRAYQLFRQQDPTTPVLYGLGNVTELIDVDSPGVNGLLAALASEVGANLLFIPEHSAKARGSVRETAQAARMMFLARRRERPPKDLGIDLLLLKEKRRTEAPYDVSVEAGARVLDARGEGGLELDRLGWFEIRVDRAESTGSEGSLSPPIMWRAKAPPRSLGARTPVRSTRPSSERGWSGSTITQRISGRS